MVKEIKEITLKSMGQMAGDKHGEFIDNQFLLVMSAIRFGQDFMHNSQPYRVEDGRVIRVISGRAQMNINMRSYSLSKGTMLVFPGGTIMEMEEKDEAFDFQIFSFRDLPEEATFKECTVFHLSEDDWNLMGEYYQLLKHTVKRQSFSMKSIRGLQTALMYELRNIIKKEEADDSHPTIGRKDFIFQEFVTLVNQYANKEHNIAFYADKLCLTPNHLGTTIREASGVTVLDWIHRRIIQQAKLLLMYSDLPVGEIADQLNFSSASSFCKFFKKKTDITPLQYREESERR